MEKLPLVRPLTYPTAVYNEVWEHWEATSPTAPGRAHYSKESGRAAKLSLWAEMVDEMEAAVFDQMENPQWAG